MNRLLSKLNELEDFYELLSDKIKKIRRASYIETDTSVKFKLEEEIKEIDQKRNNIEEQIVILEHEIAKKSNTIKLWSDRDVVEPSFRNRVESAKNSLFLIGLSFETTFRLYRNVFKNALNERGLVVKLLMLHPNSLHVEAYQPFSSRRIKENILGVINKQLKSLFDELTSSAQKRFKIKVTHYLPRFAARIYDEETMLLNFYLYKTKAHENPVIELSCDKNPQEFMTIYKSLDEIFNISGDGKNVPSNHCITREGEWIGLPKE